MATCDFTAKTGRSLKTHIEIVSPGIDTFSAGDAIGPKFEISGATLCETGSGKIVQADVIESLSSGTLQKAEMMFFFSRVDFTGADNNDSFAAGFSIAEAEDIICYGPAIEGPGYNDITENMAIASAASSANFKNITSPSIYCQAVAQGAATYSAGAELIFRFHIARD